MNVMVHTFLQIPSVGRLCRVPELSNFQNDPCRQTPNLVVSPKFRGD
ncbi:uncharacterized protein METZ01_LOCUS223494, partial [marine metagenome]